jgi:tRNA threonylcarbamoyl adenosine modification protein YjeE
MPHKQILYSLDDTKSLAGRVAPWLKKGDVLALKGDLGAGKTAFARFLIQALSGRDVEVNSPTFTLLQTYPSPAGEIWHYDLYRIEDESALAELGLEDALAHLVLIEWPERLGRYKMPITATLTFTLGENNTRTVEIEPSSSHLLRGSMDSRDKRENDDK